MIYPVSNTTGFSMNDLIILGSIIGNTEKALNIYRKFKKENSHKWANYWLGVVDSCIHIYEETFNGKKSRVIEIAKEEINYGK